MKPRELYSGAAPTAMAMMGQGLPEVGANIARITQQGTQALGQGIGQAAQAIGEAYSDYKKMGADIKASRGFYESLRDSKLLPEEIKQNIDSTINSDSYKHSSTADKAAYWNNIKSFTGQSIAHNWAMDKLAAESTAAMARQREQGNTQLTLEQMRGLQEYLRNNPGGMPMPKGRQAGVSSMPMEDTGGGSDNFGYHADGTEQDTGDGIVNDTLPLAPEVGGRKTKGMGLPTDQSAAAPGLLIPANPVDTFAPAQKKSFLPLVGNRPFTPEEVAIYSSMTDQQRGEWHRKNDGISNQQWSPNSTYVPAIRQK